MTLREIDRKLKRFERILAAHDPGTFTLEELLQCLWRRDPRRFRELARSAPSVWMCVSDSHLARGAKSRELQTGIKPDHIVRAFARFRDHSAFCEQCLSIRNLAGSTVPLQLSPGQLKQLAAVEAQRAAGKPVRLVILKPRRTFFTVGSCALMFHEVPFLPGQRGLIIADKYNPAALEAFDYLRQFQQSYRPVQDGGATIALPRLVKETERELQWANGSAFEVLSAEVGELRGAGRHFLLLDEVAFWRNATMTLTGVLNMVPYEKNTMVIVQSTANGVGGEFYDLVQKAQDPANDSDWRFLFFSWLEHPHYRIELDEMQSTRLLRSLTREEAQLQQKHGATVEQLAWRRKKLATECRGNLDLFRQEYPTTVEEAFLVSGRPAFDHAALSRHPVSEGNSGELKEFEQPPRRFLKFVSQERGALTVWNLPQAGHQYVVGADPSKGIDVAGDRRGSNPDYSVAFVVDQVSGLQVAQFRARSRPVSFAKYLAALAWWHNWAYVVPESNDSGFVDALVEAPWPIELIYHRQRNPTDRRPASSNELGFETTSATREWLLAAADEAIRSMSITIRSPIALQECRTFVIKPNGKKEHQTGCHDDCVFALALAAIGMRFAPKDRSALVNVLESPKRRFRIGKIGDKLGRDEDAEDESDHKRPFRSW